MKYLFVGGPADGEWRDTEGEDRVNVCSVKPIRVSAKDVPLEMFPRMAENLKHTTYRIRAWAVGDDEVMYIYTPNGTSDKDTFKQLLKGYRP